MSLQNWEKAKVKKSISPLCPGNQLTVRNPHRVWLTEDSMVRALVPGSVRQGLSNTNSFSINDYIINCLIQQEHNACQAAFVSVCLRSRIPSRGSASTELAKSPSVRSPQNRLASGYSTLWCQGSLRLLLSVLSGLLCTSPALVEASPFRTSSSPTSTLQ